MKTSPLNRINEYEDSGFWESLTLHELLLNQAEINPNVLAVADPLNRQDLVGGDVNRLTFSQLQQASVNLADIFIKDGISSGDICVVQLPNIVELVVTYMALSQIGAIISPVPIQYGLHELAHIIKTLKATRYISFPHLKDTPFAAPLVEGLKSSGTLNQVRSHVWGDDLVLNCREVSSAQHSVSAFQQDNPIDANHIVTICWTSGTTGTPKGVPRSHNMWVTVARNCIEAGDYQAGDRLLNPFPLVNMASIGSFLFPFVLLGCSLVLHHPFDPTVFLQQMQLEKITFTIVPPAMLNQLAKNEAMWNQFDFTSLRSIGSGSAPLAPWMIEQFDNVYGKQIVNFYGSNEGINLFSTPSVAPEPDIRATMFPRFGAEGVAWSAKAAGSIQTKVIDVESGQELTTPGKTGELVVKGPTLFDGYYDMDNSEVFTSDGYFLTGDLVEICGEGNRYYRISGRCKDIINRGGMKLSPVEIDVLLEGLPGALEAAVCAYPDDHLGERVCACVVLEDKNSELTLEQVVSYLEQQGLSKIKLPERLVFLESLPRNPLGKVQRFILQDLV